MILKLPVVINWCHNLGKLDIVHTISDPVVLISEEKNRILLKQVTESRETIGLDPSREASVVGSRKIQQLSPRCLKHASKQRERRF